MSIAMARANIKAKYDTEELVMMTWKAINRPPIFAVFAAFVVAALFTVTAVGSNGPGPGTMSGAFAYGGGGAGPRGTGVPSAAQLARVRDRVDAWLAESGFRGFSVAEVMAFTNNDYVSVRDPNDVPAFELLTDLHTNWLMEEPPSMMWNTRYGGMGDFRSSAR